MTQGMQLHGRCRLVLRQSISWYDGMWLAQKLYGKVPRVRVPRIHWDATARRVLCMEWVQGCKVCSFVQDAGLRA